MSKTYQLSSVRKKLISLNFIRCISLTPLVLHNPALKKKVKVVVDQKKLERQKSRQELKMRKQPVVPPVDLDSIPDPFWSEPGRQRENPVLTEDEKERRILLQKEWARFQMKEHISDLKSVRDRVHSRSEALRELKKESLFLYEEALKVDKNMFPLVIKGPLNSPPFDDYIAPDFVDEK